MKSIEIQDEFTSLESFLKPFSPDFSQMAWLSPNIFENANIATIYSYWLRNQSLHRVCLASALISQGLHQQFAQSNTGTQEILKLKKQSFNTHNSMAGDYVI